MFSINVEWLGNDLCIKYIMKYITKGVTMAFVDIQRENEDATDYDEFHQLQSVRFKTADEAYLSIWGHKIAKMSHTVNNLFIAIDFLLRLFHYKVDVQHVHEEDKSRVVFEEGTEEDLAEKLMEAEGPRKTQLTEYFELNKNMPNKKNPKDYTYDTIHEAFWWDKPNKKWIARDRDLNKLVRISSVAPGNRELQV